MILQKHTVQGAAGRLQVEVQSPVQSSDSPRGLAVVCHPHPLFGGSMSNKVATTLATTAARAGYVALRFNFRGVGNSEGVHNNGLGETDDTLLLLDWLQQQHPQGLPTVLMGFSFGGYVATRAASQQPSVQKLLTVAPALRYFDDPLPPRPRADWHLLHSEDDDIVSYAETHDQAMRFSPPPIWTGTQGCGHFFHGKLGEVQEWVAKIL
jgi:hypothetical protein